LRKQSYFRMRNAGSQETKEGTMVSRTTALVAALSMIAATSLLSAQAQAGASASAPSKNNHNSQTASNHNGSQYEITQFTSSSAKSNHR
jgi:hypothetical protein